MQRRTNLQFGRRWVERPDLASSDVVADTEVAFTVEDVDQQTIAAAQINKPSQTTSYNYLSYNTCIAYLQN